MRYRYLGKQKTLSFGVWPEVSLAEAREKRDAAHKQIAEGLDPMAEKKPKRIRAQIDSNTTFKAIAEEWVLKREREESAKRTLENIRWLLDMAYPLIGTRPINDIEVQEVLVVLRKLEATGRYESARRMRSVISRVLDRNRPLLARCRGRSARRHHGPQGEALRRDHDAEGSWRVAALH